MLEPTTEPGGLTGLHFAILALWIVLGPRISNFTRRIASWIQTLR